MLWDPFFEIPWTRSARTLGRISEDLARWFEASLDEGCEKRPRLTATPGENEVRIRAEVPGLGPEDLEVEVDGDSLTLSGTFPGPIGASAEDGSPRLSRRERPQGRFRRTLRLPFEVEATEVRASLQNGLLELYLPRAAASPAVRVPIRTETPNAASRATTEEVPGHEA